MAETIPNFLMTLDQIADRWHTSRATPYRAILSGRLPGVNVGLGGRRASWRVRLSDLVEYEKSLSTPGRKPSSPA